MRIKLLNACLVICAFAVASCDRLTSPVGEPPLTGTWTPIDFNKICGVDTPCDVRLRLMDSRITGDFEERVFFQKTGSETPLHGTFNAPSVHFEWDAPYTQKFDGELRDDTLMVGIWSRYDGSIDSLHWVRSRAP